MVAVSSVNACVGILTHLEALDLQTKANLNLLLTWNSDQVKGILTGKLFEYVGARNPILALVKGSHDRDLDLIFSRFRCGEVVYSSDPDREEMIDNFIVSKYEAWLSGQYAAHYNPREPVVLQSWELQADKFWNFIIQ